MTIGIRMKTITQIEHNAAFDSTGISSDQLETFQIFGRAQRESYFLHYFGDRLPLDFYKILVCCWFQGPGGQNYHLHILKESLRCALNEQFRLSFSDFYFYLRKHFLRDYTIFLSPLAIASFLLFFFKRFSKKLLNISQFKVKGCSPMEERYYTTYYFGPRSRESRNFMIRCESMHCKFQR